jgi:thiol peroxidase
MLSDFKTGDFGKNFGLTIEDGPMAGLHSRCIVVVNTEGKVIYTEQIGEIVEEPNYELALASL